MRFVSRQFREQCDPSPSDQGQSANGAGISKKKDVDYPSGKRGSNELKPGLMIDLTYRLPGRGAYCHEETACLLSKQVLGKLCYSLEVGSRKRKKFQEEKREVHFSLKDLLLEAKERYLEADKSDKKHLIVQKLNALERWVESEYGRVKDLRHKRRVRL